jgi:hypothetical protein
MRWGMHGAFAGSAGGALGGPGGAAVGLASLAAATSPRFAGAGARGTATFMRGMDSASKQVLANKGLVSLEFINGLRKAGKLDDFVKSDASIADFIEGAFGDPQTGTQTQQILQEASGGGQ